MLRPVLDLEVLDTLPGEDTLPVQDEPQHYAGEGPRRPRVRAARARARRRRRGLSGAAGTKG
jgi:hypothetical protein